MWPCAEGSAIYINFYGNDVSLSLINISNCYIADNSALGGACRVLSRLLVFRTSQSLPSPSQCAELNNHTVDVVTVGSNGNISQNALVAFSACGLPVSTSACMTRVWAWCPPDGGGIFIMVVANTYEGTIIIEGSTIANNFATMGSSPGGCGGGAFTSES